MSSCGKEGMDNLQSRFTEATLEFWRPATDQNLSEQDATDMIANIAGLLAVLNDWSNSENDSNNHKEIK